MLDPHERRTPRHLRAGDDRYPDDVRMPWPIIVD